MATKRVHEDEKEDFGGTGTPPPNLASEVLSPRKTPRYDFFADLKKRKEGVRTLKIAELKPGKILTQELTVAVAWISRHPDRIFSFQGFDGVDFVAFKVFAKAIPKFQGFVKMNQVVKIKNFIVATVDEKFRSRMDGKLEIILSSESTIEVVDEIIEVPFDPMPLEKIAEAINDSIIDVKGILVFAEGARKTTTNKMVREYSMIDQTETTISLYLWEKDAEDNSMPLRAPIALRNVQVKEYGTEKVLWFLRSSSVDGSKVDSDGSMAAWFSKLTDGIF